MQINQETYEQMQSSILSVAHLSHIHYPFFQSFAQQTLKWDFIIPTSQMVN